VTRASWFCSETATFFTPLAVLKACWTAA
jgi:hypothetical protein